LLAALASAVVASQAAAWGFTGHRLVSGKAVATLPAELRPLFAANTAYLAEHSIDPDLWRAAGEPDEGPNHYLNLDAFGSYPFADLARDEAEHLRRHGAEAADKGRAPWRVGEAYAELVHAFRRRDAAGALRAAAVLGHYVSDAHVPLHAVLNYDGQSSGQAGLHARWESGLVERYERQLAPRVEPGAALRVRDPVAFTLDALRDSFAAADGVLASDLACRGARDLAETRADDRYDDAYYSKLYAREGTRVVARLTASAEAVGALWRSAWEDAGRPALDAGSRFPYVRGERRALLLSLDGASARVLDEAVARGVMPALARLRRQGSSARGVVAPLPAKTAPGHAALYTGAWSDRNGVVANAQPRPDGALGESESGFLATALTAEPLWVTAARQGLRATVLSAPQSHPFAPYTDARRFGGDFGRALTLVNGYQFPIASDAVLSEKDVSWDEPGAWTGALPAHAGAVRALTLPVAGARVGGLLFDDPDDPAAGFDTLLLRAASGADDARDREGLRLKPAPTGAGASAFGRLALDFDQGRAAVFWRLFALAPDGSRLLLYHSGVNALRSSKPGVEAALIDETGGFVANSAVGPYERGELGASLPQGGDGTAERRYLETVALALDQFGRLADFGLTRTAWDLMVLYVPFPDDFFHLWLGALDATLDGHDAALAARLRPFFDEALALVDGYVGRVTGALDPDTVVALASDHGQVGANRRLRPNVALRDAGLVGTGDDGRLDLARTQALYFAGDAGFVLLNRAARPGGVVRPEDEDGVARRVREALLKVRGRDGQPVVLDVIDARHGGEFGLGGAHGGDLYLSLAPGYLLSPALDGPLVEDAAPRGQHLLDQQRPGMTSLLLLAGPGIAVGADLGTPSAIDVAPTLAHVLGLDPPAQSAGRVLEAALARAAQP
jgi:hypothetical protein